jgi:hypothetical protein
MKKALSIGLVVVALVAGTYAYKTGRFQAAVASAQASNSQISELNELLAGTLELEGTDQAVTAEQAPGLLTLWKAYVTLSDEDTTSDAELAALVDQAAGEMTTDQLAAVDAMALTNQDVTTILQEQGVQVAGGAAPSNDSSSASAPDSSQMAAGGDAMMAMGGDMSGDITGMAAGAATGDTGSAPTSGEDGSSTPMLEAVITLLNTKVA